MNPQEVGGDLKEPSSSTAEASSGKGTKRKSIPADPTDREKVLKMMKKVQSILENTFPQYPKEALKPTTLIYYRMRKKEDKGQQMSETKVEEPDSSHNATEGQDGDSKDRGGFVTSSEDTGE